ncbi:MAG: TIGR04086 family membrane protein [Ruminococcus callidus]|nr:TIGR04086 family membrane protein [Ruminococcus callidus]
MNRRTRKAAPRYRIYLFAGVGGLLLCMGILSAGAWMASLVDLPRWGMEGILLAALGSGAYTAALLAGRRRRRHGLPNGLLLGAVLSICMLSICAVCTGQLPHLHALVRTALAAVCGGAGGVQGVNQKQPGVPDG